MSRSFLGDCWEPQKCCKGYITPNIELLLFCLSYTRVSERVHPHPHTHALCPSPFVSPWWSAQQPIVTLQARGILRKAEKPFFDRGVSNATQLYCWRVGVCVCWFWRVCLLLWLGLCCLFFFIIFNTIHWKMYLERKATHNDVLLKQVMLGLLKTRRKIMT